MPIGPIALQNLAVLLVSLVELAAAVAPPPILTEVSRVGPLLSVEQFRQGWLLRWTGEDDLLEFSETVAGPWRSVPEAESPWVVTAGPNRNGFYRLALSRTNNPPAAETDSFAVPMNGVLNAPTGALLANDRDEEGDPLTVTLEALATFGELKLNGDGSFQYTPAAGFAGVE